jgi:hypothetical protein
MSRHSLEKPRWRREGETMRLQQHMHRHPDIHTYIPVRKGSTSDEVIRLARALISLPPPSDIPGTDKTSITKCKSIVYHNRVKFQFTIQLYFGGIF